MITITTYRELTEFVQAFSDGHLNMLVICSVGGLGKSEEVRRTVGEKEVSFIGGHITPLKLYELLHEGKNRPVVFDEIDGLFSNTRHVGLLKQLCETREEKRIMWASSDPRASKIDGGVGYFHTRSHVLMLCNSFAILNANVAALESRANVIRFTPSSAEILAKTRSFGTDEDVIAFLDEFHESVPHFTLRTYRRLVEMKNADLDWRRYALEESDVPAKVIEIADLLGQFTTDIERIHHYSGSRRDYYNWKPRAEAYRQRRA
ncbi:MAG: hypothetical protein ACE5EQ_12775, partial [Phycisphaerae bacterium]